MSRLELHDYSKLEQTSTQLRLGAELMASGESVPELIRSTFDVGSDSFSSQMATCKCGRTRGEVYLHTVCSECGHRVTGVHVNDLNYKSYVHIAEPLPAVLQPSVYHVLKGMFKTVIDKIIDPTETMPQKWISLPRGLNNFREHFDEIIDTLLTISKKSNTKKGEDLKKYLDANKDLIWVRDLPIMNSSLHTLRAGDDGVIKYSTNIKEILNALWILNETQYNIETRKIYDESYVLRHVGKAYLTYMKYVDYILREMLFQKPGAIRKHVLGTRCHFSARAVIIPLTCPHSHDEVHLPWRVALELYELELYNKLFKLGYSMNSAWDLLNHAKAGSDSGSINIISILFDELIDECPYKGLPVLLGRNPSLRPGAIQVFFCTHIKINVLDETFSIPPEAISAPNADFDGDCMWLISIKEMDMVKDFINLIPSVTTMGFGLPEVQGTIQLRPEIRLGLHSWLNEEVVE